MLAGPQQRLGWKEVVGGGLRWMHAARERAGWVTPTQAAVLNEERDTALL